MTTAELQRLSSTALHQYYQGLTAESLPLGTFDGTVLTPGARVFGLLWRGKVFYEPQQHPTSGVYLMTGTVLNRIGPWLLIQGFVNAHPGNREVVLDYPHLHLQDRLKPVSADLWLGQVRLWGHTIWFTLAKSKTT